MKWWGRGEEGEGVDRGFRVTTANFSFFDVLCSDCVIQFDVELLSLFCFSHKVPGFDDYITITVKLTNQKFLWNVHVLRENFQVLTVF